MNTELDLVKALASGDQKALSEIYESNYSYIEKMILKNSGDVEDAKDIYQDAMLVFYKNAVKPEFRLTSTIKTYLYGISWRLWMKKLSQKKELTISHKEEYIDAFDFELVSKDADDTLNRIVNMLREHGKNCLEIMERFYFSKQSFDEIAEVLGYASGQVVREQKYRCIKRVREGIKTLKISYELD
ncbi:MAG: sigma-70 family RNA polymerase sigma factor [Cyclobacteriaceae bacterium]